MNTRFPGIFHQLNIIIVLFIMLSFCVVDWAYAAPDLLLTSFETDTITRYNGDTGNFVGNFVSRGSGGLDGPIAMVFGPDGNLYVSGNLSHNVVRYDGQTGQYIDTFVSARSGGLDMPRGIAFGPDNNLYVGCENTACVLRYDGTTGNFIDTFVEAGSGGVEEIRGLTFGPDGNLYICSLNTNNILKYNGSTGEFLEVFISAGSGGLAGPRHLVFHNDEKVYVTSFSNQRVYRYSSANGEFIDEFVSGYNHGMIGPIGLTFGPDGHLYVVSEFTDSVQRYHGQTGNYIDEFVTSGNGNIDLPSWPLFMLPSQGDETPTPTWTPTITSTPTNTPTDTFTNTPTFTPTHTFTPTMTETPFTWTPTATPTVTPTPTEPLMPAPENLEARAGADNVFLSWEPGTGIDGQAVTYRLYRSMSSAQGPWDLIAGYPVGPELTDTYYTHYGVEFGKTYWFFVTKVIEGEESAASNVAFAKVGSIEIYIPDVRVAPDTQGRIQVAFSSAYNVLGSALTLWVDYPENLVTYTGWEKTPILAPFQYPPPNTADGIFRLAGVDFEGQPMVGEGRILEILVDVPADAIPGSTAAITLDRATLYDSNGNPLDVVKKHGLLTVVESFMLGDVNGDGIVDAGDALVAGFLSVGREDFPGFSDPESYQAADVNADRNIDSSDVVLILRLASGYPLNPPEGAEKTTYLKSLAQAPSTYEVDLSDGVAMDGETVTLSLNAPDLTQVAGALFELSYDPTLLEFVSATQGDLASSEVWSLVAEETDAGVVKISTGGNQNIVSGGGQLVKITFKASSEYELSTPIRLTQARLARQYGEKVQWTADVHRGSGIVVISSDPLAVYDLFRDGQIDHQDLFLMGKDWGAAYQEEFLYQMMDLME